MLHNIIFSNLILSKILYFVKQSCPLLRREPVPIFREFGVRLKLIITLFVIFFFNAAYCQKEVPVFTSGTEGYKSFRIPAIIGLPNKNLLAFCEGRINGAADFGNVDIVMKKSTDNGKTWSALQIIVDANSLQAGNCAPVVDTNDPAYPKGRIPFFFITREIIMKAR